MAKWGEGDPRWLVEERPDATNVNNWHWAEKNASHWSKSKFEELLVGTKIETDVGKCQVTEISKVEGDAVVNNRKAKLIFFYEWNIEMKWNGSLENNESNVKGNIQIPNLSEEHDIKDVDVIISLESAGPESEILKDLMRSVGTDIIREKLSKYVALLKEEFAKNLILPTKDVTTTDAEISKNLKKNKVSLQAVSANASSKENIVTCELKHVETFKCTAKDFFQAMTVKELVQAFTQGNCVLVPEEGGRFELFDGNVHGNFVKLEPEKKIVQKWRFKTWPDGHFSDVVIDIEQKFDCTEVTVTQTGIPKIEVEKTREGWRRFYWDSMKRILGFGAILF